MDYPHTWNGSWRPRLRSSWAWSWRASDPVPRPRRRCHRGHRGHRWNQRRTGEFWVENAGEKPRKMEKKQVSKGLKSTSSWLNRKKLGNGNGFEPIGSYEFTIVFPIFGRKSQARHQQYRESPMQEMPGTQWVKTFGTLSLGTLK